MTEPEPIGLLHRDEWMVVADKPPGLLVHRSRESADRVFLLQRLGRQLDTWLYPVHRLDRAVSGAIVFALSSDGARQLQAALGSEASIKQYLAVVRGEPPERGSTDRPLTGSSGAKQAARTDFERLATFSGMSLLRLRIHTGRRHQIRRHLNHLRHQILGDTSYGKGNINRRFRAEYGLPRLCLHAWRVAFEHPWTGDSVDVRAPLAQDLRDFLARLPDFPKDLLEEI